VTLTFDLLFLKVVLESRVMSAISVPILVFLGLSVLDFVGPMYATDRQTDRRQIKASLLTMALISVAHVSMPAFDLHDDSFNIVRDIN